MRFLVTLIASLCLVSTLSLAEEYQAVSVSIPLVTLGQESSGKAEMNLWGKASAALEGTYFHREELLSEKEIDETGDSLVTVGREITFLISRYTRPMRMAGFYWTIGAGYMTLDGRWEVGPDEFDKNISLTDVDDETGNLNHNIKLRGVTGHGRLGYRWVGQDWPVMVGAYMGLRHFEAQVEDAHIANDEQMEDGTAALTERERERIKKEFKTQFKPGLEFGWSF